MAMLFLLDSYSIAAQVKQINLYPQPESVQKSMTNPLVHDFKAPIIAEPELVIHMPLLEPRVTSGFGWRRHPVTGKTDFHRGVDLAAKDKIVRNIMKGRVIHVGYHKNLGNYVRIDHGIVQSVYGHLSTITVQVDQVIEGKYPVGITGSTGRVTGEHLHFAIIFKGIYINPLHFLQRINNQEY